MQCFYPISIKDPKSENPANRISVPCGRCAPCLGNRRQEWVTRLEQELRVSDSAHFLTLTYAIEPVLDGKATLVKADVQKWMKRLRKALKGVKIKYYLCGEYGSKTYRPHYHAIMFNLPYEGDKLLELLLKTWKHGFISVGTVTSKSINYTLKYMLQPVEKRKKIYDGRELPFALMSKGLGISYIDKFKDWHLDDKNRNYVVKQDGQKFRLPRYFREKLYNDTERRMQFERGLLRRYRQDRESDAPQLSDVRDMDSRKAYYEESIRKRSKNSDKL